MADGADQAEISSVFERLFRNGDNFPFLIPFALGFANRETQQNPDSVSDSADSDSSRERLILINPFTRSMMVIGGSFDFDSIFQNAGKQGPSPASKSAVEAMTRVEIRDGNEEECDCVICLEEMKAGELAAEMPCKHRFHENCVEKWLGIHGTCPVCRYEMPVDEDEEGKKRNEGRREIWVSFNIANSRRSEEEGEGGGRERDGSDDWSESQDFAAGDDETENSEN